MSENQFDWYDIYDIVYQPFWQRPWFVIMMLLISLAAIGLFVWLWNKQRQKNISVVPYWQRVHDDLEIIQSLCNADQASLFYIRMTVLLKQYLESRYDQSFIAKTDQELVAFVRAQNIPTYMQVLVADCIEHATYVKFANQDVVRELMQADLNACRQMIEYDLAQNNRDEQVADA